MKKLTLLLSIIISISTFAQTEGTAFFIKSGYIYAPGAKNAFTQISSSGIRNFTDNFSLLGVEGIYRIGNYIVGSEISIGTQKTITEKFQSLKPYTGAGHVRAGFIVWEGNEYWLYPSLGAGISAHNLGRETSGDGKTNKIENISAYSPSVDFGLNGELLTTKENRRQKNSGGLIMGFRMGYRLSFGTTHWKDDNGETVLKDYSYKNNAYYLVLAVGLGWFRENQ